MSLEGTSRLTASRQGYDRAVPELWTRLDEVVASTSSVEDLLHHGLGAIGARQWRERGQPVPKPLCEEERFSAAAALATPLIVERVRAEYDGLLLVLKGPAIARHYPDPGLRPQHDLDLLAEDPAEVHRALVAAGCRVRHVRDSDHHEPPLAFPDLPLMIELHGAPKWPAGMRPPSAAELFAAAVPSPWAGGDVLLLPPDRHAVLVAAHAWAHRPLRRVLDLVDVLALLAAAERGEADAAAAAWDIAGVWRATTAAADAMLCGAPVPWTLRSWARNLPDVRERSPTERFLQRVLAPFAVMPAHQAALASAADLLRAFRRTPEGDWRTRLQRTGPGHPSVAASRSDPPARH